MSKTTVIAEPGTYEIVMEREFNASRERVFKAHTDPEAVTQWWGPSFITTIADQYDARTGGTWRLIQRDQDGNEWAFFGIFHECTAPERLVRTWEFEAMPGVSLETVVMEELPGGRTKIRMQSVFQSVADRDAMLQAGAAEGAAHTWDRLDELLARG